MHNTNHIYMPVRNTHHARAQHDFPTSPHQDPRHNNAMADRLTQLQDAVDQIATQFFSAIRYISTHHDAVPVGNEAKVTDEDATIDAPDVFEGISPSSPLLPGFSADIQIQLG